MRPFECFATGIDDLAELIPGRRDYRALISTGVLMRAYSVSGQVGRDGAVELVSLEIDVGHDWT